MKLKYILLIALAALAFSVLPLGGSMPAIAGGNGGINGGDVHSAVPAVAAGNGGVNGGDVYSIAGRKPGASGGSEV